MCGSRKHHNRTGGTAVAERSSNHRASDADRESVVTDLRTHAAEGRLTVEELEERIDGAYAAKTRRDLVTLTTDLPRTRRPHRGGGVSARPYLQVMVLLVVIWAL